MFPRPARAARDPVPRSPAHLPPGGLYTGVAPRTVLPPRAPPVQQGRPCSPQSRGLPLGRSPPHPPRVPASRAPRPHHAWQGSPVRPPGPPSRAPPWPPFPSSPVATVPGYPGAPRPGLPRNLRVPTFPISLRPGLTPRRTPGRIIRGPFESALRGGWSPTYGLVQVGRAVGVRAGCRRTGRIPQPTSTYLCVPTKCPPVEESPSRQPITLFSALYMLSHKGARTT